MVISFWCDAPNHQDTLVLSCNSFKSDKLMGFPVGGVAVNGIRAKSGTYVQNTNTPVISIPPYFFIGCFLFDQRLRPTAAGGVPWL